jgi:SAM-dependent methyltransferase
VTACDLLPEMLDAARAVTTEAGVEVELLQADIRDFEQPGRRFDAIYFTPTLYSFIPGRQPRVATLRRLRRHLAPGGSILFSVQVRRSLLARARTGLAWLLLRRDGWRDVEHGDWYTWYLTREGELGTSYVHLFTPREAWREAREAGFAHLEWLGAHLLVSDGTLT